MVGTGECALPHRSLLCRRPMPSTRGCRGLRAIPHNAVGTATCVLFSVISFRRTDAGALVETDLALRSAESNVVEVGFILRVVSQFAVDPGQFIDAGLLLVPRRVYDARKSWRGPAGATDSCPAALQIDRGAAEIRCNIGISTLRSDDSGYPALIARDGLKRAEVAASTTSVVDLVHELAVAAVEVGSSNGHHVRRRARIDANSKARITAGGKVDDAGFGEVVVPIEFLGNFGISPAHADHTASSFSDEVRGELDG